MKGISNERLQKLNLWKCCDKLYAANCQQCRICGNPKADNNTARDSKSQPERSQQQALELPPQTKAAMVNLTGKLLVRITRQINSGGLDDDNLTGGIKELRDSIAEMLGRSGDSEKDGLRFEYCQLKGQKAMIIEIFEDNA